MKMIIALLVLLASGTTLACSCSYDYGSRSTDFMNRMGQLLKVDGSAVKVIDHEVRNTAMAYTDPDFYSSRSCGCTQFVKRIWNISFKREGQECTAKAILQVWNDKMKVRVQECI